MTSRSCGRSRLRKMHMEEAANLISSLQQTLSEVDAVVANVNERSKRTILHIETAAQRLVQAITEHRHKLVSKVCEITEAKLHALQGEKELVQDHFRVVEDVLRCAQNTGAVEDSEEWESALSRQLKNLKGVVFDFQEYNEDMRFHFLYRDENLLAAICRFGDVFTVPNDARPKVESQEAFELQANGEFMEESVEEFATVKDLDDAADGEHLLMEFQENLSSPGETTVSQVNFVEAVLTQVFEETVDVTQLKEDANECKELIKEDITTSEEEEKEAEGVGDSNETKEDEESKTAQETIPKTKKFDCSDLVEHQASITEVDDGVFSGLSAVIKEPASTAIEDEIIKDLNNNSGISQLDDSLAT